MSHMLHAPLHANSTTSISIPIGPEEEGDLKRPIPAVLKVDFILTQNKAQ